MPRVNPSAPDAPPRRARARATQWRIVKAAFGLFCERGYSGTTMAQIAEAAGVAVQTVYFTFHTKAAVLSRAYDFAVMGEGEPHGPLGPAVVRRDGRRGRRGRGAGPSRGRGRRDHPPA